MTEESVHQSHILKKRRLTNILKANLEANEAALKAGAKHITLSAEVFKELGDELMNFYTHDQPQEQIRDARGEAIQVLQKMFTTLNDPTVTITNCDWAIEHPKEGGIAISISLNKAQINKPL